MPPVLERSGYPAVTGRMIPGEARVRDETRQKLADTGIPAAYIDQVVDLGFEAAELACEKLQDVVFAADDERVSITALGVAISVAQMRLEALQQAMLTVAAAKGKPVRQFRVGGAANG